MGVCQDCGGTPVQVIYDGDPLCDDCRDRRTVALTGMLPLPEPPPPEIVIGPDGRRHDFRWRLWRGDLGVFAEVAEAGTGVNGGYQAGAMGSHHVDVDELVETVRSRLRAEVGRLWLEPHPGKQGWTMAGWELAGRLEWYDGRPAGDPYDVVVDGRTFSWDELGRFLEPFEGMRIRVLVEEVIADERPPNDAPPALSLPPMVTGPEAGGDATGVEPVEP